MQDKIKNYLLTSIIPNKTDLQLNEYLIDSGLIDSISIVKMIIWIEEEFKLELEEEDLNPENFETIQNICDFIKRKEEK